MSIPAQVKGMKLIKQYEHFALYGNKYKKECFTYFDLGVTTPQEKIRRKPYMRCF